MNIISWIKEAIKKLFNSSDIKKAIQHDVVISDKMINAISEWNEMYKGKASWINDDLGICSLRLEKSICAEFANTVLSEMNSKVTIDNLDAIYQKCIDNLNEKLQMGLAGGSFIIKPLGPDNVEYVMSDSFVPVEFDENDRLIKVVFIETRKISDTVYYRRMEYHSIDDNGLTITNKAYKSATINDLGSEIQLNTVYGWEKLPPVISYPLMDRPAFGYYRNPLPNTIDGSQCGISIYETAKQLIKQADIQYGRLNWEFESGERAVHIDSRALKIEKDADGNQITIPDRLRQRMYRGLDIDMGDGKELFDVFSPDFRDQSILNGLNEQKRAIELNVGLSYGDISNPQEVEKTATEIKSAKQRKYTTVNAIESNLKDCMDDLVYALAFYNGLTQRGYDFICDFKDSILTDEETERKQDLADLAAGIMNIYEYRMKWYGEDEATAKANIPQQADVIPDGV